MRGNIAKGAAWMVLFRLLDRSIGLISTAILARLLIPADFGLVAMAMSIIAVIELATSFSFEMALIQKSEPQRAHFDTAWSLNILLGTAGAIITAAAAYPAAQFYGDMRLGPVMAVIAAAWLMSSFDNVGTVNFRREMNFAAEFRLMATKRLMTFVVTASAAYLLRSYWALVAGMAFGRAAGLALSYYMHPFRPRWSLACSRELFSFSGWVLANNMAGVIVNKVPHFFVGRMFGAQSLGAYTVAAEIAQLAHTELVAPINRAMFPGYSRLVSQPEVFRKICLDATSAILLIVLPVSVGVAVLSGPFVRLLLGPLWGEAVPVIEVLAFAGAVSALTSNNASAYLALGRPHLATTILAARVVVLFAGVAAFASTRGPLGVAYAELAAAAASLLVSLPTLFTTLKIKVRDYLSALWRPTFASMIMGAGIVWLVQPAFEAASPGRAARELLAGTLLGAFVYPLAVAALWWLAGRPESVEVALVRKGLELWRRRQAGSATI